jgi:hypothetical protein
MSLCYTPDWLNLNNDDIDLQAVTSYSSPVIDVTTQFRWMATLKITNVGGAATTGLAKFTVTFYEEAAGTNVVCVKDTVVNINTKVDGQQEIMAWGGPGSAHDGSGTPSPGADALAVANFMKITVEVTEVNNAGTSADAEVYLYAEELRPA